MIVEKTELKQQKPKSFIEDKKMSQEDDIYTTLQLEEE